MTQDTQILLNLYCNGHMRFDDGTCCAGVDPVTSAPQYNGPLTQKPRSDKPLTLRPWSDKPLAVQQTVTAAFAVLRQLKTHVAF